MSAMPMPAGPVRLAPLAVPELNARMAASCPPGDAPRAPRAPVTFSVQHQDDGGGELLAAEGENISASGIFIRCEETYTVGTRVRLRIALPGSIVEARGRVVRVGPGASGHTGMGIMFTTPDAGARAQIERLVAAVMAA
jgi:uncharacterized protein (TIGR02266 family)